MIKELIQQLANTGQELYAKVCKVTSVDEENQTADVEPLDGSSPIYDVYLVVNMEQGGFYLQPKVGSLVCVAFINKETAIVVGSSALDKVECTSEGFSLKIENGKIQIKNEQTDFKSLLNDLLIELKSAIIQTPAGTGNFAPQNVAKFDDINNKINALWH
nr:MAG TPA: baseplate protein [Caudoviricetes sp.]